MNNELNTEIQADITEPVPEQTIAGENVFYKSEQLVPLLGLDADQIRYRAKEYDEFLHTNKTKGGHLRFTDHDVEMLRKIQHLMDAGYSKAEIKAILRDPETRLVIPGRDAMETEEIKRLLANNEFLITRLSTIFNDVVKSAFTEHAAILENTRLLVEKKHDDSMEELRKTLENLTEQNQKLIVQLNDTNEKLSLLEKEKERKGFMRLFRK